MPSLSRIYTVGHSQHPIETFLGLLSAHGIATLVDVRSMPASRRYPWFNRMRLAAALDAAGIAYRFLGDRLGGRPKDSVCYAGGAVDYAKVAVTHAFRLGLDDLAAIAAEGRSALMCAERDPLDCHRAILVGRHMATKGFEVVHIHGDGHVEEQRDFEERLMRATDEGPLFDDVAEPHMRLQIAYNRRGRTVAFRA
jgi:uncharacterized protein (DUF488 family)